MKIKTGNIRSFVLGLVLIQFMACQSGQSTYVHIEPAHLEHIEGTELTRLTLTEKAIERIDIKTASVKEEKLNESGEGKKIIIPYASVLYDPHGKTWVYTNPKAQIFIRHEIKVDSIIGSLAYLAEGPPEGTRIVTSGAAELLGTEYEVGH